MASIFITGSGWFGATVAEALLEEGHRVVGSVSPATGRHAAVDALCGYSGRAGIPWADVAVLRPEHVPDGTDLIVAAHSHAFVGRRTRARARAAIGYHPSLLPVHRGRDAVKWQARLHERVVGGTVFHLTDRVDGGPIAFQEHRVVHPNLGASKLWREVLAPLGVSMLLDAVDSWDVHGSLPYRPQNDRVATWEPSLDAAPLYRPELLELGR